MHPAISLTQGKGQQRQHALIMLGALVLGVHLFVLSAPGLSMWQIQPEPQKLGPLQTRILPSQVQAAPMPNATSLQPRPQAQPKPRPTAAPSEAQFMPPAGITAMASDALPAPEPSTSEPIPLPTPLPIPLPENEIAGASQKVQPVPEAPQIAPETTASSALPAPALSNALMAKTGDFPPNTQINYKLTGQERGLIYHASGSLKWQAQSDNANSAARAYEAELRVRAFLVGTRVWRSTGSLTNLGLAPLRYSDSWRGERAAHFERVAKKISFSGNSPSAELQAGAQDQVSLFIQMAAAVSAKSFEPGSQLNVQTATARDAVNWALTFKSIESIEVDGKQLETQRWVCLPRGKFDSQIEMWLSQTLGGLPVRIKISQASGNFIDMEMRNTENLPALPS
jgi:hypothetical protein